MESLLHVSELKTAFNTDNGKFVSVDHISFDISPGETLAIVGESGSGKSVTALSIMQLLGKRGTIENGKIVFNGKDIVKASKKELQALRGNEISMVFQEPMSALNPVLTIGYQLTEVIKMHLKLDKKQASNYAKEMLEKVGLSEPDRVMKAYPFALSGGMRQRVMIAMALACKPKLLIADEPTTALDVTVQAQIMRLMKELCAELNTAILLITHDLGVVAEMADKVIVMYAGQVVEAADVYSLFDRPMHPYTQGLLQSIPSMEEADDQLYAIPGAVPSHYQSIQGCRFFNRCPMAKEHCNKAMPELFHVSASNDHVSRCFEWESLQMASKEEA